MAFAGTASADEHEDDDYGGKGITCGYEFVPFGKGFVFPEHHEMCAGDHPETVKLKRACRYSLDNLYPDVGTLIARGYIPYFDILSVGGISHWLHPGHIKSDVMVDPGRPETVLVNNNNYCPQGIMFIPAHERAGTEPPVYAEGCDPHQYKHEYIYHERQEEYGDPPSQWGTGVAENCEEVSYYNSDAQDFYENHQAGEFDKFDVPEEAVVCAPWHRHTDLPARFAWWYYRQVHDGAAVEEAEVMLWCVVPAMFHVWPHAEGIDVYKHDSPPGPRPTNEDKVVCRGGYSDPYLPDGDETLSLEALPADVRERAMPADLERELRIVDDIGDETAYRMTIADLKAVVR